MDRVCVAVIVGFAFLTAALASHTRWAVSHFQGTLWCGNVVSDPLLFHANTVAPIAAACLLCLVVRRFRQRRCSIADFGTLVVFIAAGMALHREFRNWYEYTGMELGSSIWWLPRHWWR